MAEIRNYVLQGVNCCRNSRLVVDEDDLKWLTNSRKLSCIGVAPRDATLTNVLRLLWLVLVYW